MLQRNKALWLGMRIYSILKASTTAIMLGEQAIYCIMHFPYLLGNINYCMLIKLYVVSTQNFYLLFSSFKAQLTVICVCVCVCVCVHMHVCRERDFVRIREICRPEYNYIQH
jgi:hypothetical protein